MWKHYHVSLVKYAIFKALVNNSNCTHFKSKYVQCNKAICASHRKVSIAPTPHRWSFCCAWTDGNQLLSVCVKLTAAFCLCRVEQAGEGQRETKTLNRILTMTFITLLQLPVWFHLLFGFLAFTWWVSFGFFIYFVVYILEFHHSLDELTNYFIFWVKFYEIHDFDKSESKIQMK